MTDKTKPLSRADVQWLHAAVEAAEDWRGSLVGNPDPMPLRDFDRRTKRIRIALDKAYEAAKMIAAEAKRTKAGNKVGTALAAQNASMAEFYKDKPVR